MLQQFAQRSNPCHIANLPGTPRVFAVTVYPYRAYSCSDCAFDIFLTVSDMDRLVRCESYLLQSPVKNARMGFFYTHRIGNQNRIKQTGKLPFRQQIVHIWSIIKVRYQGEGPLETYFFQHCRRFRVQPDLIVPDVYGTFNRHHRFFFRYHGSHFPGKTLQPTFDDR